MAKRIAVTMTQVATQAGVSQATVSLVLNGADGGRVSEDTRKRVKDAVEQLGYRTNAFAKSLRSGHSGMIGFISDEVASAPFAGELLKGAQQFAWETGNVLLSVDAYDDAELEAAAVDMMLSYRVSGVIYASMYHRHVDVPKSLEALPSVVVNAQDPTGRFSSVFPDEVGGGYAATRHLLDAGHHRIAMINIQPEDSDLPAGVGRLEGYRRALEEKGLVLDPALVAYGSGIVADGFELTSRLMAAAEPPTAIFCGNDRTAWGAYRALEALGKRPGRDVAIVGFDNHDMLAPNLDPALTTVALPYEQMARQALQILLDGPGSEVRRVPVECTLIERESVMNAKVQR